MPEINFLKYLWIFLISAAGGAVQSMTGFGMAIVIMTVYPVLFPFASAIALSGFVCTGNNVVIALRYRKHIRWSRLWLPTIVFLAVNIVVVQISYKINVGYLKAYFGLFLLALAVYFLLFAKKVKLKGNHVTAAVSSAACGVTSGLFGIGGPLVVPYYLAVADGNKYVYLATIQIAFIFQNIVGIVTRAINGSVTVDLLLAIIPGVLGMFLGTWVGGKVVDKINADVLTKIIYFFLAAVGIFTFVTNIIK